MRAGHKVLQLGFRQDSERCVRVVQVVPYGDRIELVPVREIGEMRGFLAGMDPRFEREPDREL